MDKRFWKGMTYRAALKRNDKVLIGNIDNEQPEYIDLSEIIKVLEAQDFEHIGILLAVNLDQADNPPLLDENAKIKLIQIPAEVLKVGEITTDESVVIEEKYIRANVSSYTQPSILAQAGDERTYYFDFEPTNLLNVFVQTEAGVLSRLNDPLSDYTTTLAEKKIVINKPINDGDTIVFQYEHLITE
ncbi:hypothetical protein [Leeuwenhoekiella sp. ZYFB001]|uniref:hypothetical protein n=1 Tax=Leeuwenhoekiella sp. ZYFB001 TaxID=2719912 RepID=UPI001431BB9A|nr:hypothetical protein [Leeuwenhoekiella sp. ZYFB001]